MYIYLIFIVSLANLSTVKHFRLSYDVMFCSLKFQLLFPSVMVVVETIKSQKVRI